MLGNTAATGIDGYSFASSELFRGLPFSDLLAVIFFEGFALAVVIKLKRLVGMAGQRVGEASNPGPAGAAATRRKRKQRQQAQQAQQGAQLQQVLQMMMTIIQVLVPLLGAKGQDVPDFSTLTSALQAQLGGNVARSSGDTRRSTPRSQPTSRASPSATQTDPPETPPSRRTVFVKEPEVVEIPAVGASKPVPKRSEMRRETKLPPTAPQGSSASRTSSVTPPAPPSYSLRSNDWHGSVVTYQDIVSGLANTPLGGVVFLAKDSEQADAAQQLLREGGTTHACWILVRDVEGDFPVPMMANAKLVVQKTKRLVVEKNGVAQPSLRQMPKPKAAPTCATAVVRLVACKPFVAADLWQKAITVPRRYVEAWANLHLDPVLRSSIRDAWGFAEEKRAGRDHRSSQKV